MAKHGEWDPRNTMSMEEIMRHGEWFYAELDGRQKNEELSGSDAVKNEVLADRKMGVCVDEMESVVVVDRKKGVCVKACAFLISAPAFNRLKFSRDMCSIFNPISFFSFFKYA